MATAPDIPSTREGFHEWLRSDNGYVAVVPLPGDRWAGVLRLMFHWSVHVGKDFDLYGHDERYCYRTFEMSVAAIAEWALRSFEGEPKGWHKAPYTGRIRPNGDAAREYLEDGWA